MRSPRLPLLLPALGLLTLPFAAQAQVALPRVQVVAQKEVADLQIVPSSVTALTASELTDAGVASVRDAATLAPNLFINEFTARKLSNPYFRGIGSSPNNPGVTTAFDGVPQLNANSSNIELLDVAQVEFLRGAAGPLFGRNTLGGLIAVTSRLPEDTAWSSEIDAAVGNYDAREARVRVSGPLQFVRGGVSFAAGMSERDGFTKNTMTGNDLDSRDAVFGKFQANAIFGTPCPVSARFLFSFERDRDGDYALGDLASLRKNPHTVSRDYEGYTRRDIYAPTLILEAQAKAAKLTSTTGYVDWSTTDATDLDYTPYPLMTRWNRERQHQFTQEFRAASHAGNPVALSKEVALAWQAGVFFFAQAYNQNAGTNLSPMVAQTPFALREQSTAALDDTGIGLFAQGRVTFFKDYDLTAGLRFDNEDKDAALASSYAPPIAPGSAANLSRDDSAVSPQIAFSSRIDPDKTAYVSATRGFKAGGFNAVAPTGASAYGQEKSWNYEVGLKAEWFGRRLRTNVAAFYIDWEDLQLNEPVLTAPGRFYIANAGSARSRGIEAEFTYRIARQWDVFGSVGTVDSRFAAGSLSSGLNVGGRRLPNTPSYTGHLGTQLTRDLAPGLAGFVRVQVNTVGPYHYSDLPGSPMQTNYSLTDVRAGVRARSWYAEASVRNLFDKAYIPIALPYSTAFAPSGFIGECGAPLTFTLRGGLRF